MKLTDEKVAKALGWKKCKAPLSHMLALKGNPYYWLEDDSGEVEPVRHLPRFTESLDAIVAEIEAREIDIELKSEVTSKGYYYACLGDEIDKARFAYADTAPLALCAALLAYLKERPE